MPGPSRMFRAVYGKIQASPELKADPAFHDLSGIFDGLQGPRLHRLLPHDRVGQCPIAAAMADRVIEALGRIEPAAMRTTLSSRANQVV